MQVRTGGRKELLGTVTEVKDRTVLILARQKRPATISFKVLQVTIKFPGLCRLYTPPRRLAWI
jgi:hypothetical protein